MAEGTPGEYMAITDDEREMLVQTARYADMILKAASADMDHSPGIQVAGLLQAAAVILGTDWQGDEAGMVKAWGDAVHGFAETMLHEAFDRAKVVREWVVANSSTQTH